MAKKHFVLLVLVAVLSLLCGCAEKPTAPAETTSSITVTSTSGVTQTTVPSNFTGNVTEMVLGEYKTDYSGIQYSGDLLGQSAYIVSNGSKKLILYAGKEIGSAYAQALMPAIVNNKAFYVGIRNNKYYAVYDGKELGDGYFRIWSPGEFRGEPIYVAEKLGRTVLVENGTEVADDYQYVWSYAVFGDKVAYLASKNNETYLPSDKINSLTSENRRYIPPEGVKAVVNYDGTEYGRKYDTVVFPMNVGGKLAYVALKDGKKFIVYDGMEGESFSDIYEPMLYDGKVAFLAQTNTSGALVYDGAVKAEYYRVDPLSLKEIDGKLSLRAADKARQKNDYFIWFDGKEIGREYDNVVSFVASGNKQAYVAEMNASRFIVYDGHEIRHGYNYIDPASLSFHNDKLSFIAQKGGVWYIVREE